MGAMRSDAPVAAELVYDIRRGILPVLHRPLAEHPGLARARIVEADGMRRALLQVATDRPRRW